MRDSFGFIKCAERPASLFFHFSDLDRDHQPRRGDEVRFTVVTDLDSSKTNAARIELLPKGTVSFEVVEKENVKGVICREMMGYTRNMSHGRFARKDVRKQEAYGGKVRHEMMTPLSQ